MRSMSNGMTVDMDVVAVGSVVTFMSASCVSKL